MNYTGYYKFKKQMNSEGKCNVNYKVSVTFDNPGLEFNIIIPRLANSEKLLDLNSNRIEQYR
jgi:hypothetical protein